MTAQEIAKRKRAERCVHFTGVQNKECKAGCPYERFIGSLPCLPHLNKENATCEKYLAPTPEQIAKEEAEIEMMMARFMKVGPIIKRIKLEHKGQNWRGVEACPVCNGKLHMSHAADNGHVHGRCETENCLAWME